LGLDRGRAARRESRDYASFDSAKEFQIAGGRRRGHPEPRQGCRLDPTTRALSHPSRDVPAARPRDDVDPGLIRSRRLPLQPNGGWSNSKSCRLQFLFRDTRAGSREASVRDFAGRGNGRLSEQLRLPFNCRAGVSVSLSRSLSFLFSLSLPLSFCPPSLPPSLSASLSRSLSQSALSPSPSLSLRHKVKQNTISV